MRAKTFLMVVFGISLVLLAAGGPAPAQTGQTCGGIGGLQCPEGQACQYPGGRCNVADLAGTCVELPATCPQQGPPVCGCDGKTYANECELLRAGARQDRKGACGGEGKSCKQSSDCTANSFCEFKAGTCGERGAGHCAERPEACTQQFDPVCGCDNKTYGNDCQRQMAGVSLRSTGECPQ